MSDPTLKPPHPEQGPQVHFEHVNSLETVHFKVAWTDTLAEAWEQAYGKLEEPRRAEDRVQTDSGRDMLPHLQKTVEQLRDQKLAPGFHFQIVGPTGGAVR